MQVIKGMTIYCDAEDYEIVPGSTQFQIVRNERVLANLPTLARAEAFVRRRTNPQETRLAIYQDICRCGVTKLGWDYFTAGGIVYERCNTCKNPLRMIALKLLKEEMMKDFDLEDLFKD